MRKLQLLFALLACQLSAQPTPLQETIAAPPKGSVAIQRMVMRELKSAAPAVLSESSAALGTCG